MSLRPFVAVCQRQLPIRADTCMGWSVSVCPVSTTGILVQHWEYEEAKGEPPLTKTHTYPRAPPHTPMHIHKHMHAHARTHTHTCTHTHTHVRIHTHTHTIFANSTHYKYKLPLWFDYRKMLWTLHHLKEWHRTYMYNPQTISSESMTEKAPGRKSGCCV